MTLVKSPTVARVTGGDLCTGCGLCASVSRGAITMRAEPLGFNRPEQVGSVSPETEAVIAASCPGAVVAEWNGASIDPYWGPYHRIATGSATNPDVRFLGSSGGMITALAIHALETGFVDRVVHVQADPDAPADNRVVVSRNAPAILAGAGSRYVASSPLAEIDAILAEGGRFAFVGKPCDVSALRQLARVDARVNAHAPLMFAFFCAGIPSRQAVRRVVEAMHLSPDDLESFRFRGEGWPGRAKAVTRDGQVGEMSYEASWGGHLSRDVQFRCKICPDAVGGVADIACADAWYGGETGYPQFEEQDGRSLVLSRTEQGEAFLAQAVAAGVVQTEPLEPGEIQLMQPSQARRRRLVTGRVAALTVTLRPSPRMTGLHLEQASARASLPEKAKNFLGSLRRSLSWWLGSRG